MDARDALEQQRGQSLAYQARRWVLCQPAVPSALIGASGPGQVIEAARMAGL